MQYKKVILLLLMLWANKCFSQSFASISKKIMLNSQSGPAHLSRLNHKIRLDLYKQGKLDFVNSSDTIWILGSQITDSGILLGRIWTRKGGVDYSFQKWIFDFKTYKFSQHECDLIERWDTAKIKAEEKTQLPALDGGYNYGTRVIKTAHGIKIDNVSFNQIITLE